MNSIRNWQCIAHIISLNFINVKKHNRMIKLQIILKQKENVLTPEAAQAVVEV